MIWNDEFLFLHYPKAAGKSLSLAFVKAWRTPVRGYVSAGQLADLGPFAKRGSTFWVEGGHQNAMAAAQILGPFGIKLSQFRAIFVAVRCPYELAYSTYKFQRRTASDVGAPRNSRGQRIWVSRNSSRNSNRPTIAHGFSIKRAIFRMYG